MDTELWKEVLQKIDTSIAQETPEQSSTTLDQEIVDIYDKVALILSRYKSGKLPKAFKVIPNLKNWEQVLHLTRPETWTPNATHQAAKIFLGTFSPKLAARFLTLVILPKIRMDFEANKKLNPHYYETVALSISKPSAFFTGLLIPLCVDDRTTQKEAAIMASILKKMSIPVLYSAAALIKLTGLPFYGPRSIIMRTMIDKKYSLPQTAISSLVDFIEKTSYLEANNSVLWQQLVLSLCEKYGCDLSLVDKQRVLESAGRLPHDPISSEIVFSLEKTNSILS